MPEESSLQQSPKVTRPHELVRSLGWALRGIFEALATQRNMRIHFAAAGFAATAAAALDLGRIELLLVAAAIASVVVAELFNTALEAAVDLASPEVHPLARLAKDVAAGAVLVCALFSLAVAIGVFGDKLAPLKLRESGLLWAAGAASLFLLGAAALAIALRRRRRAVAAPADAPAVSALE